MIWLPTGWSIDLYKKDGMSTWTASVHADGVPQLTFPTKGAMQANDADRMAKNCLRVEAYRLKKRYHGGGDPCVHWKVKSSTEGMFCGVTDIGRETEDTVTCPRCKDICRQVERMMKREKGEKENGS